MYPVSARFLEHINGTHHALVQARLLTTTQFGANPTGTDLPILSGDVKLSATSDNKSTLEIVVPGDYRDLVMPFGAEIWVARGVDYGDTTQEMVPLGYFRIDDVEQESAPYGPVRLSCSDRVSQLKQNRVLYPFQVPEGYTHRKLFERLVNGRLSVGSADTPPQTQAAQLIRDRFILGQPILEDWTWSGAPAIVGTYNDALLALYSADGGIPAQTQAAILIDYRILCHAPINDDWTWDGMPAIVNTYNEVLRAANIAAGSPEPTVWLQQYATANGGTQPVQTQAAGIIKARLESGLAINTDWTWPDPPAIVTTYSKQILSQYPGAYNDRPTAITWLGSYISSHGGASLPDPITWLEIYIAAHGGYDTINSLGYAAMIQGPAVPIVWNGYDPDRYFINGGPVVENSSYEFMSKLADSRGCVLRFDELGQLNIDIREPDPDTPPVYAITPGKNGNLIKASFKASRDGVYNIVVAYGSDIAAPTGYQLAYNNAPNSKLRWDSQFGAAPRYYASPLLRTPGQAADAAATVLSRYTGLPTTVGLWTLPNPAIRPQDAISAKITGLPETHIVDVVTIPLAIADAGPVEIATKTLNDVVAAEEPTDDGTGGTGGGGTGQPTAAQITQEKAFRLTSTAENSTVNWWEQFSYLEDIADGRGYTCGIFGATSATGDLLELVQNYTATKPGNVLAPFLPGLQTCATTGMGSSATTAANSNLGTPFKTAWVQAATDTVFQTAQINYRNQVYWTPAFNAAVADGLSNLGLAIYYDTSINHGPGDASSNDGSFDDIRSATTSSGGGSTSTLGQTANSGFASSSSSDKTVVSKFTAGASGTLTGGHARLSLSATGSASTALVVYADAAGVPGARLAQSSLVSVTATTETLYNYVFTGANQVAIANGTSYWIGPSWQDPGTINVAYSRNSTASQVQAVNAFAPTTFGTGTASSGPVDAYIDVNTGGGGSGPPSQGGSESAWLTAFLAARSTVLTAWGDNPADGRISMFTALLGTGNFTLTCPFSWSVYGDSYTMTTDPLPYGFTPGGTGGGGTGGGGTTTWPNPGTAHNIGSAPGQNSFNLGVGFEGDPTYGTAHKDFTRSQIEGGLTIPGYYELTAAGEVLMSSHPGGGKTSNNTKYARVEYRELERDGTTKAAWNPTTGRHYIKGRSAVDSLSGPKPEMVIAQVHDASDDTAMIYRRSATKVEAKIGDSVVATLDSGDSLTHFDDWMIEIVNGTINFYWNNMSTPAHSAHFPPTGGQYFKAGAYMQWNLDNGDSTIGKVRLVNLEHWHTGWPQPARPAGQTGGGTGGSTGGGTGGSTGGRYRRRQRVHRAAVRGHHRQQLQQRDEQDGCEGHHRRRPGRGGSGRHDQRRARHVHRQHHHRRGWIFRGWVCHHSFGSPARCDHLRHRRGQPGRRADQRRLRAPARPHRHRHPRLRGALRRGRRGLQRRGQELPHRADLQVRDRRHRLPGRRRDQLRPAVLQQHLDRRQRDPRHRPRPRRRAAGARHLLRRGRHQLPDRQQPDLRLRRLRRPRVPDRVLLGHPGREQHDLRLRAGHPARRHRHRPQQHRLQLPVRQLRPARHRHHGLQQLLRRQRQHHRNRHLRRGGREVRVHHRQRLPTAVHLAGGERRHRHQCTEHGHPGRDPPAGLHRRRRLL
jgi:hypothetical protein